MTQQQLILPARLQPGFKLKLPDSVILKPRPQRPPVTFGGEYRFVILDGVTKKVKRETDWMPNLVTNYGLDTIGAGTSAFGVYCRIGTGNTAPANTDSALVSQSAFTSSVVAQTGVNAGASNYETKNTATYQFALGAVVGNMAEIGVGTASTGATLCSRALIVDGGGSPTTITVLVTEILQVVYRFYCFPNLVDATGTVTIGGVSYNYVSRCFNAATALAISPYNSPIISGSPISGANAYPSTSTLGAVTASGPSGSASALGTSNVAAYSTGNYYRDFTLNASISEGNASGGIAAIAFQVGNGNGPVWQTQMSLLSVAGTLPIPKDNTKVLAITIRQPWSRHP